MGTVSTVLAEHVRSAAHPLTGARGDYDPLLRLVGDARIVLLGGAVQGTHDFHRERARITRKLIREKGFRTVAIDAGWADAWRVNCYVQAQNDDGDATEALSGFRRFPAWIWNNTEVRDFVSWLRVANDSRAPNATPTGFLGLDLYSLHASIEAVLRQLDRSDPEGANRVRRFYGCFGDCRGAPQTCGCPSGTELNPARETEAVTRLMALRRMPPDGFPLGSQVAEDEFFFTQQSARLTGEAELYYRSLFHGQNCAWSLRGQHLARTLDALLDHLSLRSPGTKVVVWAHNSHAGDARATLPCAGKSPQGGEQSLGRLLRERHGGDCVLVGFTTSRGTLMAAPGWGLPALRMKLPPALPGSYGALFHDVGVPRFLLTFPRSSDLTAALRGPMPERAIGFIYDPQEAEHDHYYHARISDQFDAVIHCDQTRAVDPLAELPEPPEHSAGRQDGTGARAD